MLNINLYFPTVIAVDYNETLAVSLLPVAKKYLHECTSTNNLDYKSTYNADQGIENNNDVAPFLNYINEKALEYLEKCGYDSSGIKLHAKIFVSEMRNGDSHNVHIHPNCILSGIMYLQTPEGSSPIVFSDVRSARRMMSLPKTNDTFINQTETAIFPKQGMLLMWESWLTHSVPKNHSTDGRITIVFNFSSVNI